MKYMIQCLSIYYQVKIRRRSSSQGGSLDPGQVNSRRDLWEKDTLKSLTKSQSTPQATTLKIILLMSQIHKWSLCVSDVASAFLNTPIDGSKGFIHVQAPPEIQYPEPTVWRLKRQLYGLRDAPRSWQVHLNQVLKSLNLSQMMSDPCTFAGMDSKGHLNLMVMAYIDDLVVAGEAQAAQEFIQEIQKTFSLKHVDYLTPDNPAEFLGRIIKVKKSRQITMEFSQKLTDNLLGLFEVKGSQQPMGSRFSRSQRKIRFSVKRRCIQSSGQPSASPCACHNSEMTSSFLPKNCQGHLSIPRMSTSITSFIFSSMSIRLGTMPMSWILTFQQQILKDSFQ